MKRKRVDFLMRGQNTPILQNWFNFLQYKLVITHIAPITAPYRLHKILN